jgi:excisionase family DNA binding protein
LNVVLSVPKAPTWIPLATLIGCAAASQTTAASTLAASDCHSPVLTLEETAELLRVPASDVQRLAEQREIPGRRIGDEWRFNCTSVLKWVDGDPEPLATTDESPRLLGPQELSALSGRGMAAQQPPVPSDPDSAGTDFERERIGEEPDERTAEDIRLRDQRVLVNPRDVSLNFGQFYSKADRPVFAATDQGNALATLEQVALLTTFQARFGVSNQAELFLSTSYFDQDGDVFLGNEKLTSSGNRDFGNVLFGARRTLVRERIGRPNIIGTLTAHIPTDDGSRALGGSLGFVKSFDPVALFASVGYTHRFIDGGTDVTRLEPADRLDASVGFALAMNDTLSLSASLSAISTGRTEFENVTLRRQEAYSVGFGLTSRVSSRIYLEPALSFGLGGPADGFAFGLSVFSLKPSP